MPYDNRHVRYVCQSYFNIASIYAQQNDYGRAIAMLSKVQELTNSFQMRDVKIELMNTLADYYAAHGDNSSTTERGQRDEDDE